MRPSGDQAGPDRTSPVSSAAAAATSVRSPLPSGRTVAISVGSYGTPVENAIRLPPGDHASAAKGRGAVEKVVAPRSRIRTDPPGAAVTTTLRTRASVTYAIRPPRSQNGPPTAPRATTCARPPAAATTDRASPRTVAMRVPSRDHGGTPRIATFLTAPVRASTIATPFCSGSPRATVRPSGDQAGVPQ